MSEPLILHSRNVVTPDGTREAWVEIRDGRIASVLSSSPATSQAGDARLIDLGGAHLLPGMVDTHVHVNEPGRTQWEGFSTATAAAVAGGVTTIVDMPLNSIPATTTLAGLRVKRDAAAGRCHADVGFWGGVIPGNSHELKPLAQAGVCGFKCFLVPSGVAEFPAVGEADLNLAMPVISQLGLPLLVHAELPGPIEAAKAAAARGDTRRYATWLASRPPAAEVEAIRLVLRLAERHGCWVHIVHLATGDALADLTAARERNLPVTVETCPHYLVFAAEDIADGTTLLKCAPPIRGREERDRLWQALTGGAIDLIASDHSPCPPHMKRLETGDFSQAWGGIASLELTLAAVWTEARARDLTLQDVVHWMSAAPAELAGLHVRKGGIIVGHDADLVVFDADREWTVDARRLHQRHPHTPYDGRKLRGIVRETFVRGERVFAMGEVSPHATGQLLLRS